MIVEEHKERLLGEERRRQILQTLVRQGSVSVTALSRAFGCAEATLRRDLQLLDEAGLLHRTHGGALLVAPARALHEASIADKATLCAEEKRSIGLAAARLIAPGDTLALNGGTTTVQVARALRGVTPLRLVTNSIGVATEVAGLTGIEVTLTGGTLRGSLELSGPLAEQSLRDLYVRTAFIGVDGLTVPHGLTTYDQVEAQTNRVIIAHTERVVVIADHTKIGRVMMALIAPCQAVHTLVTDEAASADELDALRERGIEVIIAP